MGRFYRTTSKVTVHEPKEVMKTKLENFEEMIRSGNTETAEITNGVRAQVCDVTLHALIIY